MLNASHPQYSTYLSYKIFNEFRAGGGKVERKEGRERRRKGKRKEGER